jgi:hypothetical protein
VFIEGDVAVPPYPYWSQSDRALTSIASLLRGLHDASRRFDPRAERLGWQPANRPGRLRLIAESYGLDSLERAQLLELIDDSIVALGTFVRHRVEAGDQNFMAMWSQMGGQERFDRRARWWTNHRQEFASALR